MDDASDDPDDREAKTPNTTGSFAVFHDSALELAEKLERVAAFKERVLPAIDITGAKQARTWAIELDGLAHRFAAWPTADREKVALERPVLVARLFELQRLAEEMASNTPGLPVPPMKYGVRRKPTPMP